MTALDVTTCARAWIAPAIRPGAVAVDATAGNGRDTAFLADRVGRNGVVHAFDIQPEAIERTRERLAGSPAIDRVRCHLACHARVSEYLDDTPLDAAMFNLGWRPGGDPACITRGDSTTAALTRIAQRLRTGGRISVVAYRGHAGGSEEAEAVATWLASRHRLIRAVHSGPASPAAAAPFYWLLERPPVQTSTRIDT